MECELGTRKITGRTCNISEDGIVIEAEDAPPPGSEIRVFFRLPNLPQTIEPLKLRGSWSDRAASTVLGSLHRHQPEKLTAYPKLRREPVRQVLNCS